MDVMREYAAWLRLCAGYPELEKELEGIRGDRKAIEERFYTELAFGTGGMRGILGAGINRINVFTVRRAAAGLAQTLKAAPVNAGKGVVVAHDSRRNSALFARETALTLAARGVKALLFDSLRPVPVLSFAVRHLNAAAGVVITASHNPPQYNGFKAYGPDGAQLSPEDADRVTAEIRKLAYSECEPMGEAEALQTGMLQIIGEREVDADYTKMALSLMVRPEAVKEHGAGLRIVYTPLHGAGNLTVRRVLREAGFAQVLTVKEQELPDPAFPTVKAPNPEDPAVFRLGVELAREAGATVILATDPDCDRMGVCVRDESGEFRTLTGNQIGCLLLHHILREKSRQGTLPGDGAAVKSIVTTRLAQAICDDFGVTLFDVLTGFKFVGELIQQFEETRSHTFLFGFEESFGYLSGTKVRDKDAVNASLLLAELACLCGEEGVTLFDRLQEIYQKYGYFSEHNLSLDYPGMQGAAKIRSLMAGLRDNPPSSIGGLEVVALRDYQTGLRTKNGVSEPMGFPPSDVLYFELQGGAWACVRPSGTEPKIKLYAGISHPQSEEKAKAAGQALLDAAGELLQ